MDTATDMRARRFWNRTAAKYAAQPIADPQAYEEKLARTRRLFRLDLDVFEFGCGTGSTALVHAPHVRSYLAIDLSDEMIAIARDKAAQIEGKTPEFACGTLDDFDAPDQSFDMVLGLSILHLVPDHKAALEKVMRLLRPGGYFVSSTACLADMNAALRLVLPVMTLLRMAPRVAFLSADGLAGDIAAAGFTLIDRFDPPSERVVFLIARKDG